VKYVDEYRDPAMALALVGKIKSRAARRWVLMEICGGQTHTLMRYGIDELLAPEIELVHGPGCPVCVTPLEVVDQAIEIASRPEVTFISYGDMLRVPGSSTDLLSVKARGGDVRIAYCPTDALDIARRYPERKVVFFAIGFETTAPANAMTVLQARREGLGNFSVLASHVLVPPAIEMLLGSPRNRVQGFIAPGHVCTVMGYEQYELLAAKYRTPMVVGGFEPVDLLEAISMLVTQLEEGRADTENQYARSVRREGNPTARRVMEDVFEVCDRKWRGIGSIPGSGLRLRPEFDPWNAERVFGLQAKEVAEPAECISALVLQGLRKPVECPEFGNRCTPENPLGAPMVSGEGACAAYYRYRTRAGVEA
jgi:hydrogenase expression/formation protein HypD